jgi:antitoxin component YwqK of YwqJK toxin-antitoxin module
MIKHKLTHYPNYNIKSYIEYHNDIPHKEENYDEQGKLHGIYKEWDSKGNIFIESKMNSEFK